MPKNKNKQTWIHLHLPNSTCNTNGSKSTILLANAPKTHYRRITCFLCNISRDPLWADHAKQTDLNFWLKWERFVWQHVHMAISFCQNAFHIYVTLFIWNHYLKYFFQRVFIQYLVFINIYMYVYESLFWGFLFLNVIVKPQLQSCFQSILNVWIMGAFQSLWTNVFSLSPQIRSRIDARKETRICETRISEKFKSNFMNCVCLCPDWKLVKSLNINAWD